MSAPHANGNGGMPRTPWNSTGDLATTGLNFRSYDSVLALTGRKAGRHVNTGLVCTLGPSCADVDTLCEMLKSGMNIARFNFSHGSIESQQKMLDMLNEAKQRTGIMCAVAMDTKGPEIRTGNLENGEAVFLTSGQDVVLTTDYDTVGNSKLLAVSYPNLAKEIGVGDKVLIADGSLTLAVMNTAPEEGKDENIHSHIHIRSRDACREITQQHVVEVVIHRCILLSVSAGDGEHQKEKDENTKTACADHK